MAYSCHKPIMRDRNYELKTPRRARAGTPDSRRNCISNIREGGLTIDAATGALLDLVAHMLRHRIFGVKLADATAALVHREASPEQGTKEP